MSKITIFSVVHFVVLGIILTKFLKKKKCWKCNRTFQFQHSIKFSKNCSMSIAIAILKELKKKTGEENLSNYLHSEKQFKPTKIE